MRGPHPRRHDEHIEIIRQGSAVTELYLHIEQLEQRCLVGDIRRRLGVDRPRLRTNLAQRIGAGESRDAEADDAETELLPVPTARQRVDITHCATHSA